MHDLEAHTHKLNCDTASPTVLLLYFIGCDMLLECDALLRDSGQHHLLVLVSKTFRRVLGKT